MGLVYAEIELINAEDLAFLKNEVLLGAMLLKDMDVLIHPQRQELIVNPEHPYFAQMKPSGAR